MFRGRTFSQFPNNQPKPPATSKNQPRLPKLPATSQKPPTTSKNQQKLARTSRKYPKEMSTTEVGEYIPCRYSM